MTVDYTIRQQFGNQFINQISGNLEPRFQNIMSSQTKTQYFGYHLLDYFAAIIVGLQSTNNDKNGETFIKQLVHLGKIHSNMGIQQFEAKQFITVKLHSFICI